MGEKNFNLSEISEEDLLKKRLCELPLSIEGTWLEDCVADLYKELQDKGIFFKPPCYLADEWLTPDGEPVVGIPFYLADTTLTKLEKKMMLEAEGCTRPWCMQLLRHETGHAINYAYKLHRRKKWQKMFGSFSQEYADTYKFRPYSKNYVRHLESYYAQYHPDEDFAETFSVWITPNSNWQDVYKGWKALGKLNYVDELISEIKAKEPIVVTGKRYWEAHRMKTTLGNFYKKKMKSYAEDFPDFHDANLKKIFVSYEQEVLQAKTKEKAVLYAAAMIKRHKREILNNVAKWTGEKKYVIGDLIDAVIERCKSLNLIIEGDEFPALLNLTTYITTSVMNYLHTGGFGR
jgi:Putative zinc-binding metallo-peptidase